MSDMWDLTAIGNPVPSDSGCDRCGKLAELFHNEATGLALCEDCDRITDDIEALLDAAPTAFGPTSKVPGPGLAPAPVVAPAPPVTPSSTDPVTWAHLHDGTWGLRGPASVLVPGSTVTATTKGGRKAQVVCGSVVWTDGTTSLAHKA